MPAPIVAYAAKTKTGRWLLAAPVVLFVGLPLMLLLGISGAPPPAAAGSCGPGTAVPASADLPAPTIAAINALKPDYETAAPTTNLSWSALAAVDYREDGNDPNRSALSGEPLGTTNPDSGVVTTTKADSLQRAGEHLRAMASSVYGVALTATSSASDLALAFLAYNRGSAYKQAGAGPERSPYVYNQFGSGYVDMTWPSIPGEPLAGVQETGRFGALTIVARLGGVSAACGLSDVDLVRIAEQDIGLREAEGCENCGPEIQKFLGSATAEAWCGDALSLWRKEAGRPFTGGQDAGGYRLAGVSQIVAWHRANGT